MSLNPQNKGVLDVKPVSKSVNDIRPQNKNVLDVKPLNKAMYDLTQIYTETRTVQAGQWIPLVGFTYPTAGTFTNAVRI